MCGGSVWVCEVVGVWQLCTAIDWCGFFDGSSWAGWHGSLRSVVLLEQGRVARQS
jgi:hypothetical protein